MATTESDRRHQLHIKLDEVIGVDNASTLMEGLTTREYLDFRFGEIDRRFDMLVSRLEDSIDLKIERAMRDVERSILLRMTAILTLIITVQTVLGAVVRN